MKFWGILFKICHNYIFVLYILDIKKIHIEIYEFYMIKFNI